MAAMADGLPLDANVPGEPTDPAATPAPPAVAAGNTPPSDPANDPPITVEITPEPKGYDVERGLALAVTKFELKTPVPLRMLLRQIVEMSALPIDLSKVQDDPRLDHPITLDLKDTTLHAILTAALDQAQLEFTGDAQGIHLHPGKSP
jgi:antitoxin component of RelBE/YafQ-DinJ toxin-antitoxin module